MKPSAQTRMQVVRMHAAGTQDATGASPEAAQSLVGVPRRGMLLFPTIEDHGRKEGIVQVVRGLECCFFFNVLIHNTRSLVRWWATW